MITGILTQKAASGGSYPTLSYTTNLQSAWSSQRVVISGYTGNLIRLRRSSDNAESDFGFDSGTGDIDNAAITTWLSGATAYYVKIYDQVNSNDYTQAITTKQPIRTNDRPYGDGNKKLLLTSSFSNQNHTIIDHSEGLLSVDRNTTADHIGAYPYAGLMFMMLSNTHNASFFYFGNTTNVGRYYIIHSVKPPTKVISYHGIGSTKDINIVGHNNAIIRDTVPTLVGSAVSFIGNVKPSLMYDGAVYSKAYTGYLDERFLYSELLSDTNLGTVKTYMNDKYNAY